MTVYTLKNRHEAAFPRSHFFDRDTLKFFGECLSSMNVLKRTARITTWSGDTHECYVLSKLSKNYPSGTRRTYAYFDASTYEEVFPKD